MKVPIKVVNEVERKVLLNNKVLGGIKVQFYNDQNRLIKEVVSQRDGTFHYYYSDLKAGSYTYQPNTTQLETLGMIWQPKKSDIQFEPSSQREYSSGWVIELSKTENVVSIQE